MARSARSEEKPQKAKNKPMVVDERPLTKRLPRSTERGNPNIPIRTVLYVEMGDSSPQQINAYLSEVIGKYAKNEHPHYIMPVRDGRVAGDIAFEGEFLKLVHELCEVDEDGEIVLKNGSQDVDVIRKSF